MDKRFVFMLVVFAALIFKTSATYAANGSINVASPVSYNYAHLDPSGSLGDDSFDIAVQFVKSAQLYKSLSLLLLDSVKTDQVVEKAISEFGFPTVKNSVVSNIKYTTDQYRTKWVSLLAGIYSEQFDHNMLKSILDDGENSPYYTQFIVRQSQMNTNTLLSNSVVFREAHDELIASLRKNFSS